MNKIKIISDKNRNSIKIKKSLSKITQNSKLRKSDISIVIGGDGFMLQTLKKNIFFFKVCSINPSPPITIEISDFLNLLFCVIFERDFLIFIELRFLSEIILILFIVVPSARLELALRKRQGF